MKIIELKPLIRNNYLSIPLSLLMFYVGIYSGINSGVFKPANIIYIVIGLVLILLSFEKELFGILRYIKLIDNKIIYKRAVFVQKVEISTIDIKEINFYGSKIYINSDNNNIIINIDSIKMKSRLELRDFFIENFNDLVIFTEQDNIFVERYKRKLKKIEDKQKLKNEQ